MALALKDRIYSTHKYRKRNILIVAGFVHRQSGDERLSFLIRREGCAPRRSSGSAMPGVEEEIVHLREKAAQFVALAKEHGASDEVRHRLMTVAADLYTRAAELEEKRKRGAA